MFCLPFHEIKHREDKSYIKRIVLFSHKKLRDIRLVSLIHDTCIMKLMAICEIMCIKSFGLQYYKVRISYFGKDKQLLY